ncbi:MAG: type II secretion system F family protein [Phycisphaerae bacterium]|jgi:tight adherence protein B
MPNVTNIIFLVLPVLGSMLLVYGVFQVVFDLRTSKQKKVVDRLSEGRTGKERQIKESLLRKHINEQHKGALESVVASLQVVAKLQRVLDQADVSWSASRLLVNLTGISVLTFLAMLFLQMNVITSLACSAAVIGMPLMYLVRKRKKRIRVMVEQLPDVFELMGQALRAGHSLASAIQLVSQQLPDPIAGEFARVFHEQNLGIKIEEALLNMAERVDQMDVRFFVTAVLIQRQTGGDLAEVLDKIGKVIRDRIQLLGTVRALTAEGRMSGWVLLLLPVLVFFVSMLVNPDYAHVLLDTRPGQYMLGTAIAMDLMGMAMIKKIVNIKV